MVMWIQFILSALIIVWAGNRLTRSAAVIAAMLGIGTSWAGVLLLPLATSLPELVTSLRAVAIDAPNLALVNIFGSILYNLALLALIDLAQGRGALTAHISRSHILTASFSVITLSLAVLAMLSGIFFNVAWVGGESIFIAAAYLLGSRMLYKYEKRNLQLESNPTGGRKKAACFSKKTAIWQYLISAGLIIAAGVLLTDAAEMIALETSLGQTVIGTLLLAVSTSLPETVTTLSAVRLGFLDMAVANVFGANFMNMFILFWADLFYRSGPITAAADQAHLLSALVAVIMTTVIIAGIIYRTQRELVSIGYDSLIVLGGYIMALYLVFFARSN